MTRSSALALSILALYLLAGAAASAQKPATKPNEPTPPQRRADDPTQKIGVLEVRLPISAKRDKKFLAGLTANNFEVYEDGKRQFRAKRGGLGGRKAVYRAKGFHDTVQLSDRPPPQGATPLLKPLIRDGKIVRPFESLTALRKGTSRELALLGGSEPHLGWR